MPRQSSGRHAYDGLGVEGERLTRWRDSAARRVKEKEGLASSIVASSLGFNVLRPDPEIGKRKKKQGRARNWRGLKGRGKEEMLEIM